MTLIGVDVGGTFTDVVAIAGDKIQTVKVPTKYPDTEQSVLEGAAAVGVTEATVFNHASTHGLNAIITRRLPKIGFLTTQGHRDMLDQGRAWRPPEALTDPHWRRPFGDAARPLVPRYMRRGIAERVTADGAVLIALDEDQLRRELAVLRRCNVEGIAICLLNSYVNPVHEIRVREIVLEELGDIPVSTSSEISPLAKEFARATTTVIDVFMHLIYGAYTDRLTDGLGELGFGGHLNYANCAAQLIDSERAMERPFEIVFAGPAAGTVSSAHFGQIIGANNLLCADVGGTSSDISLVIAGEPLVDTTFELEHDMLVNALSNKVASIGAGGGSLVTVNSAGEIQVGPGSAGADPGPACYGKDGMNPTTTDTCLLMGIVDPDGFAAGKMKLDAGLSLEAFNRLGSVLPVEDRIRYAFHVGVNNIAEGINQIVIQHGLDPRDFSLMALGAAGPMLLPAAMDLVHAAEVIVPPHPGLFSALGLVSTDQVVADSRSAYTMLTPEEAESIDKIYRDMETSLRSRLSLHGEEVQIVRTFDGRLAGQTWETPFISVPSGTIDPAALQSMIGNFHKEYESRWGNRFDAIPVQGVTYRVEAVIPTEKVRYPQLPDRAPGTTLQPKRHTEIRYLRDEPIMAAEYERADLAAGDVIAGPAIIREPLSTTFILDGQQLTVGRHGELRIGRSASHTNDRSPRK
ncbi:MAG: hydantoinase/oxoprolinase family protein [Hyphomicrobiales bacterium]|nr:MAG: hydantoinase/oxoprolinase family protein [Hyphomicrobiales bacterium]